MSITPEAAEQHKHDNAVLCCRLEEGSVITAADLEDPAIFPDLEDSGLLTIPENTLKIGEAIGATMTATLDSLTAITPDVVEGAQVLESEDGEAEEEVENAVEVVNAVEQTPAMGSGVFKLYIKEGKDINIEIPMG